MAQDNAARRGSPQNEVTRGDRIYSAYIATGRAHHYNPTSGQFEALTHEEQGVSAIPLRHI
ncbi:MAG: hypothetical protein ACI8UD_000940 [Planctomycetota bacterium]|jgi:hypothetical protein